MTYEPLHHKYRPQRFAELVGQSAITTTLCNALLSKKIAPAYLFTGPRGTGKTSSARILAKSLNCINSPNPTPDPCGICEVCRSITNGSALDVIEIDAASNTGVDNIREIIERSQFAPVQCRYKVYVIDECHMLSTAAFNALLKTLEEPPERVIFVLATTDPQRVLPTIISRCQRFDYRRIPLSAMVEHLKIIADNEKIEIDDSALTLVAQIANGGLRDAESLLDQLSLLSGLITPDRVWDLVGAVPERDLLVLMQAIRSDDPQTLLESCRHLLNRGKEPLIVLQNLAGFYLNLLIAKTAPNRPDMVAVTAPTWQDLCQEGQFWQLDTILKGQQHLKESENQLRNSTQPRLWLEVTLLGLLPSALQASVPPLTTGVSSPQKQASFTSNNHHTQGNSAPIAPTFPPIPTQQGQESQTNNNLPPTSQAIPPSYTPSETSVNTPTQPVETQEVSSKTQSFQVSGNNSQIWSQILVHVSLPATRILLQQHCQLVFFDGNVAHIGVASQGLLKMVTAKSKDIENAFHKILQKRVKVQLQVGNESVSPPPSQPPPITGHIEIKSPTISPSRDITPPESQFSDEELLRIRVVKSAHSLAQFFNGTVKFAPNLPPKSSSQAGVRSTDETSIKVQIRNRPPLTFNEDDEDIPF